MQNDLIEQFRIRRLIQQLNALSGNGTSMITLILPPGEQIPKITKKLTDELGAASNIKSRVNRLSVESAIESVIQRLKSFTRVPPNGLVLFCGEALLADGKVKKLNIALEPYKPINTSMYMCDSKFHTEAMNELLESNEKFGFIIMDGSGSLFGLLQGSSKIILQQFSVDLPKKHGRGGQSKLRFERLRQESYQNYIRKVSEIATQVFITNNQPNITGLVLAGSASFKNRLSESNLFDPRLKETIIKIVDISYGGENGFNQAITAAADSLSNLKITMEKKVLTAFFTEIAKDTNKYVFGLRETMSALETRAVDTLIVWDELDSKVVKYRDANGTIVENKCLEKNQTVPGDVIEETSLLDFLAEHFQEKYGCKLVIVSNKSSEGTQFANAFKIGGITKYMYNPVEDDYEEGGYNDDLDDFM